MVGPVGKKSQLKERKRVCLVWSWRILGGVSGTMARLTIALVSLSLVVANGNPAPSDTPAILPNHNDDSKGDSQVSQSPAAFTTHEVDRWGWGFVSKNRLIPIIFPAIIDFTTMGKQPQRRRLVSRYTHLFFLIYRGP